MDRQAGRQDRRWSDGTGEEPGLVSFQDSS